jgi:hypothetical protein
MSNFKAQISNEIQNLNFRKDFLGVQSFVIDLTFEP